MNSCLLVRVGERHGFVPDGPLPASQPACLTRRHKVCIAFSKLHFAPLITLFHSPSVSVSVSVSLVSCPASPSVSLSSSLDSTGVCLLERFGLALDKPPVFNAFIWPAMESYVGVALAKLQCSGWLSHIVKYIPSSGSLISSSSFISAALALSSTLSTTSTRLSMPT